jgi:hypothetical protein
MEIANLGLKYDVLNTNRGVLVAEVSAKGGFTVFIND